MQELNLSVIDTPRLPATPTPRDWAATGFRRSRLMALTFVVIFGAVALGTWLMPPKYDAQTKILVKNERTDPIVSPGQSPSAVGLPELTEMELNSEVEILKSQDLLQKVAVAAGLDKTSDGSWLQSLQEKWIAPPEHRGAGEDMRV